MAWRPLAPSVAFLVSSSLGATAHSSLLEATPHDGAVVPAGDVAIELRFDSRLDSRFSKVTVLKSDGSRSVLRLLDADRPGVLKATGMGLGRGNYALHWQVLSADGHADRGEIRFEVGR